MSNWIEVKRNTNLFNYTVQYNIKRQSYDLLMEFDDFTIFLDSFDSMKSVISSLLNTADSINMFASRLDKGFR